MSSKATGVQAEWVEFAQAVLPKPCGRIQLTETRKAFYAGAAAMMKLVQSTAELPEDQAMNKLMEFGQEIQDFADQLEFQASINKQVSEAKGGSV